MLDACISDSRERHVLPRLPPFARHPRPLAIVSRSTSPEITDQRFLVAEHPSRKLAVILHADVVGSTALVQRDETLTHERTRYTFLAFSETIEAYGGMTCELRGDALVAEFERASDAISAALAFQAKNAESNARYGDDIQPQLRIGISMGEVVIADNTVTGAGVVLAQRLEQLADPGGVCIQAAVYETAPQRLPYEYDSLGEQKVKGFEDPVRVYTVSLEDGKAIPSPDPVARPDKPELELLDKPSIAVLPFTNMSGDLDQEYFADGISEDIITGLSKFAYFFVISRNSTFTYKGASVNVNQVARDLGVQYVLEGSVRKFESRIRITVQLVDAIADKLVWAERYDRELKDVFQVQDEIAQSIVTSVAPEYFSAEMRRAQRIEERNLHAWDAFMRGYWHFLRFTENDNAAAQRLLRKAMVLDPQRSNYHSLLATSHVMDAFYGWSESREASLREAGEYAEAALAMDDQDTQALRAIGLFHFYSKNHDVALSYYERAVAVNPNEAENRALLGAALGVSGDYDAALDQIETAMRLSPRDGLLASWYSNLGIAAFLADREEGAAEWARKAVQANPQFPGGYRTLAASYGNLGRLTEAETAREKLQELLPHLTIAHLRERLPYFRKLDDLERYLSGLKRAGLPE